MFGVAAFVITSAVSLVVVVSTCIYLARIKDQRRQKEAARICLSAVYALGLIIWPVTVVGVLWLLNGTGIEESLGASNGGCSYVLALAIAWPILLMAWDLVESGWRHRETEHEEISRYVGNKSNAAIIIGGAWALGALLSIISGRQNGHSKCSAKVIMLSLVLCVAFVLPTPGDGPRRSVVNLTIAAWQKTALNYAVGLFIVGIVMAWQPASPLIS